MSTRNMTILSTTLLLFLFNFALAENVKVVSGQLPPYSYIENDVHTGVMTEIVKEIFKRAKLNFSATMYPWPRALLHSTREKTAIYPLARIKYREGKYEWVGPLLYDKHVFLVKKSSKKSFKKISDFKNIEVGVLRNAPPDKILTKHGLTKLTRVYKTSLLANMLKAGRIEVWYAAYAIMRHTMKIENIDINDYKIALDDIKVKHHLGLTLDLKHLTPKLQKAFESMKKDGTYKKILDRHHFVNNK